MWAAAGYLWLPFWAFFAIDDYSSKPSPLHVTEHTGVAPQAGEGGVDVALREATSSHSSSSSATNVPVVSAQLFAFFLTSPAIQAITICHFCNNFGVFLMMAWLPTLLTERFQLDTKELSVACTCDVDVSVDGFT